MHKPVYLGHQKKKKKTSRYYGTSIINKITEVPSNAVQYLLPRASTIHQAEPLVWLKNYQQAHFANWFSTFNGLLFNGLRHYDLMS